MSKVDRLAVTLDRRGFILTGFFLKNMRAECDAILELSWLSTGSWEFYLS